MGEAKFTNEQQQAFPYEDLDEETRALVQRHASEIKERMRRSAQDIVEIGQRLTEVKEYLGHGNFGNWLRAEFEWSEGAARRFMQVAETFKSINLIDLNIAPSALYLLAAPSTPTEARSAALKVAEQGEAVSHSKAVYLIQEAKEDRHNTIDKNSNSDESKNIADPEAEDGDLRADDTEYHELSSETKSCRLAPLMSSSSPEHYTPKHVLDAVIGCIGEIELDPCSNSKEEPNVPALKHFTLEDNALSLDWQAETLFMNPPYGRQIEAWVEKLVSSHEAGLVARAIALVPARTDTQWFRRLRDYPVCFVEGRLTFLGNDDPAPFPSAIFYLGDAIDEFYYAFHQLGDIYQLTLPEMFGE